MSSADIDAVPANGHLASTAGAMMKIDWDEVTAVSELQGSLQMGPGFGFGGWTRAEDKPFYNETLEALRQLQVPLVRYQGWRNRPDLVVAAPDPPTAERTYWDFSRIDPPFLHFLSAMNGRPFVMNFSTPPTWASSPQAIADYFGRFASWYAQGGFTDELGQRHHSGHRIEFPYWEVLNEPDFEDAISPQAYTERYDAIVEAVRGVSPKTKFIGLALCSTLSDPKFTTHFLNPANHRAGTQIDYVSYHFYAHYRPEQPDSAKAAAVFDQADQFLDTLRYVAAIRDELRPDAGIMVTEIGAMNLGTREARPLGFEFQLSAAMYAYLHARMAAIGVQAAHVSGLLAVQPDHVWQELAMIDWSSGRPNARYWTLKLLIDQFRPGSQLVATQSFAPPPYSLPTPVLDMMAKRAPVFTQGFRSADGRRKVLLVNRSTDNVTVTLAGGRGGSLEVIDQDSPTEAARRVQMAADQVELQGLAVAVATLAD